MPELEETLDAVEDTDRRWSAWNPTLADARFKLIFQILRHARDRIAALFGHTEYQTQTGAWAVPTGDLTNGRMVVLFNSTQAKTRIYAVSNGGWRYGALI